MSRPLLVCVGGQVDMLGIRFRPGASHAFLHLDASECTDETADLDCVWGKSCAEVWDRLATSASTRERIAWLETYFIKKFGWRLGVDPYIQFSVRLIKERKGNVSMDSLERGTGLSERQIERKFSRYIGLSPKAFARVVRFERIVLVSRTQSDLDWSSMAHDGGYSDQSHLIRDFKEFSGLTPSEFIASR